MNIANILYKHVLEVGSLSIDLSAISWDVGDQRAPQLSVFGSI